MKKCETGEDKQDNEFEKYNEGYQKVKKKQLCSE
jgi:hypothetical protein